MKPPLKIPFALFHLGQELSCVLYGLYCVHLLPTGEIQMHRLDAVLIRFLRIFTPFLDRADMAVIVILQRGSAPHAGTLDDRSNFRKVIQRAETVVNVLRPFDSYFGQSSPFLYFSTIF